MGLLTFPLPINDYMNRLPIESIQMRPNKRVNSAGQGSGSLLITEIAPDFWSATITLRPVRNQELRYVRALTYAMDQGMQEFLLYDPIYAFPVADPNGSILGSATITNTAIHSSGRAMKFTGKPNYQYSEGDRFGYTYGPGNIYRAMHEIVSGDKANGSGDTGWIEFRPELPKADMGTGKTMNFKRALIKAKLIGDSLDYGTAQDLFTSGMVLYAEQQP